IEMGNGTGWSSDKYVSLCLKLKAWIVEAFFGWSFVSFVVLLRLEDLRPKMGEASKSLLLKSSAASLFENISYLNYFFEELEMVLPKIHFVVVTKVFLRSKLKAWIVEAFFDFTGLQFKLLLRKTRDGFTKDSFWRLCDKQILLVVVMRVKGTGETLGGYNLSVGINCLKKIFVV
ncbi:hypothetical protein C2G38_2051737, partial [Gigaspora rosea]